MATEVIRAASYARTSSLQQHTCQTQLALCRNLIEDRSWKLTHQFRDDALKGRNPDRPGYQRLLELVKENRIDVLVTWKLDRVFRSLKEASNTQELLAEHGVALVSVTEPFDTTTSIGKFIFGFLANVAQFETELIKERALLGYERRVREGKWTGANPPFGYQRADDGSLDILEEEAILVKKIHRLCLRSTGAREIAVKLNQKEETCRGKSWDTAKVRRVLTNQIYKGHLEQRGAMAIHTNLRILTENQFQKTLDLRKNRRHVGKQAPQSVREETINRVFDAYLSQD